MRSRFTSVEDLLKFKVGSITVIDVKTDPTYPNRVGKWVATVKCECGNQTTFSTKELCDGKVGCSRLCPFATKNRGKHDRKHELKPPGEAAFKNLYSEYKRSAKARNKAFHLIPMEVKEIVMQNCFYCGRGPQKFRKTAWGDIFPYNGIDRVDNSKGYTVDNCVPSCYMCNTAKHQRTQKEFEDWIERLVTQSPSLAPIPLQNLNRYFLKYQYKAAKRNYVWELTYAEFYQLLVSPCNYCFSPPLPGENGKLYTGIDRQDNSIGYTKKNSVSCCKFCNLGKHQHTLEQFQEWLEALKVNYLKNNRA